MIITDLREKIKGISDRLSPHEGAIWGLTMFVVGSLLVVGLWRLVGLSGDLRPITIESGVDFAERYGGEQGRGLGVSSTLASPTEDLKSQDSLSAPVSSGRLVASKNGTRYYYEHCSGVKRIKETNKIYFDSEGEAMARGLTLAANCQP
ncbi:MAG: hypothetical protein WCW56_00910 [Candidatus Paceibacterota bacterium]|jgi:hypothetical protein